MLFGNPGFDNGAILSRSQEWGIIRPDDLERKRGPNLQEPGCADGGFSGPPAGQGGSA